MPVPSARVRAIEESLSLIPMMRAGATRSLRTTSSSGGSSNEAPPQTDEACRRVEAEEQGWS